MDKLYVGDIPSEYHYAQFNNNYIDLYDTDFIGTNTGYNYYRVYLYDNQFMYEFRTGTTSNFNTIQINNIIETTNNIMYRRDIDSILIMTLIIALFGVFLINLVTSAVKRGGILGGLI